MQKWLNINKTLQEYVKITIACIQSNVVSKKTGACNLIFFISSAEVLTKRLKNVKINYVYQRFMGLKLMRCSLSYCFVIIL